MKKRILFVLVGVVLALSTAFPKATTRIKDISRLDGIRKNQIKGFGLVVGLNGQGDSRDNPITLAAMNNLLDSLGVALDNAQLKTKNIAAVMITADIDGFIMNGDAVPVQVASIGDAKSLSGGVLLQTPLRGADGLTYAVAQGSVITPSGTGRNVHATAGSIPAGAIVERSLLSEFVTDNVFTITLANADFRVMQNMRMAIVEEFPAISLSIEDSKNMRVNVPEEFRTNVIEFISRIQDLEIELDGVAKVVIDERSGVVVMGEDVRVSAVGISVAGTKIRVGGQTAEAGAGRANVAFEDTTDVQSLVNGLNELGVDIKDIIQALLALKKAGAINAEVVVQ